MSSNICAIKVSNLSKKYNIGKEKDSSFRSSLGNFFKSSNSKSDDFWAIKDVNFEIKQGEVVGIIGKNGAGKSTLLKLLSQITRPTTGRIEIEGRVASLLEVGTGFHPELTGRENIYLNGTILGMTKKEVKEKFDEIIDFAGVGKFIDTPVKQYSSGMYVRLAFAVAANLNPEILIIDEVLAVGDAEFQKKCLGKMKDVAGTGRTVIFVSHDLGAMANLCEKAILLENGSIVEIGDVQSVINTYISNSNGEDSYINPSDSEDIIIKEVTFENKQEPKSNVFKMNEAINFSMKFNDSLVPQNLELSLTLYDQKGHAIGTSHLNITENTGKKISGRINDSTLMPGTYTLHGVLHVPFQRYYDKMTNSIEFEIIDSGEFTNKYGSANKGFINSIIKW